MICGGNHGKDKTWIVDRNCIFDDGGRSCGCCFADFTNNSLFNGSFVLFCKLENWFRQTSLYQKHLEPFMDKKEMTRKAKLTVMLSMTIFMGIGFVMMEQVPVGRIILAAVWLFHILYFTLGIKTVKKTCVVGENFN